jgi:enoyl-CoA hydratase
VAAARQAGDRGGERPRRHRGLELVLNCDIVICSERATFADTHARVGVLPGRGLSVLLPLAVGRARPGR